MQRLLFKNVSVRNSNWKQLVDACFYFPRLLVLLCMEKNRINMKSQLGASAPAQGSKFWTFTP